MAAPNISSVTAAQGTGVAPQPTLSCVDIRVRFTTTSNHTATFTVEISTNGAAGPWYPCTLNAAGDGQNLTPTNPGDINDTRFICVDVKATFDAQLGGRGLNPYNGGNAMIRVKATDSAAEASAFVNTAAFNLKSVRPTITSAIMAQYVGAPGRPTEIIGTYTINAPYTLSASADATKLRVTANLADLVAGSGFAYANIGGSLTWPFTNNTPDGYQTIWLKVYDQYYNESDAGTIQYTTDTGITERRPWWQWTVPQNCIATLIGSVGNSDYTGIKINGDGTLTPDRSIAVQVYAVTPIPMTWKILASSDVETTPNTDPTLAANVGVDIAYVAGDSDTTTKRVKLTKTKPVPASDDYNQDANCTVNVTFTDAAGNTASVFPTPVIRLNTRIYKSDFQNVINTETNPLLVREITPSNIDRPIPQTMIMTDSVIRTWEAIFHPATHSWPVTPSGELDETYVFAPINDNGTDKDATFSEFQTLFYNKAIADGYDPVGLEWKFVESQWQWVISKDSDGRPITVNWTVDGSKNYENMLSSSTAFLKSWVFDNSGFGDFALEFEHFDLDGNIYGPPNNPVAPFRGDVLVIYDATDPSALEQYVDSAGITRPRIADSTRLRQLMAFTGSGVNVMDVINNRAVGAGPEGNFTTSTFVGTPKIAMILFSDASHTGSGFKLKAGRKHQRIWSNWDADPAHGEVWIHKHVSLGTASGAADTTQKLLTYYYQQGQVDIDYENGEVTFDTAQAGVVTADFSYYEGSTPATNTFLANWDDLVDYQEAPVYAGQPGLDHISSADKGKDFNDINYNYGRIVQGATWDKDRGIVTLANTITLAANQRLFADHYHHTYTRLWRDGHGDMVFRNNVLVADKTNAFPDYTWGDIKIVNEGDATLEQGICKFGFRGYDTDNDGNPDFPTSTSGGETVDQVLDLNRPWDVQKGTRDETFDRLGMYITDKFIWGNLCPRPDNGMEGSWGEPNPNPDPSIYNYNNMTARGIVGSWNQPVIGTLEPRTSKWGRMVWVLCGAGGTNYPTQITAGPKRCSMEISGKYYDQLIF